MSQDNSGLKKKWKKEISAGGIVYKKEDGQTFILLIKPSGVTQNKEKKWTFPKGLIDDHGEGSIEQSALREVKEEGGVAGKIIEKLGSIKYTYVWQGENIFKIVTWYLMEYVSGDPKDHDFEVAEAKWFELSEAEKTLVYKTDKEIFEKTLQAQCNFLQEHLLRWGPVWAKLVKQEATTDFYRGIAHLVHGSLQAIAETLQIEMPKEVRL